MVCRFLANFFIVVSLFIAVPAPLAAQSPQIIYIANGNDFKPFTDESLLKGGMISHIAEEAFRVTGWQVKYKWLPWRRGYEMARNMEIDAALPWTRRADTINDFVYSDPLITILDQVWTKEMSNIQTTADLKGEIGCNPIGYTVSEEFKPMYDAGSYKLVHPKTMTACFKMLAKGRVSFILCNNVQGVAILRDTVLKESGIKPALTSQTPVELFLVMSKLHPNQSQILSDFNEGLKALKANRHYAKIIASY